MAALLRAERLVARQKRFGSVEQLAGIAGIRLAQHRLADERFGALAAGVAQEAAARIGDGGIHRRPQARVFALGVQAQRDGLDHVGGGLSAEFPEQEQAVEVVAVLAAGVHEIRQPVLNAAEEGRQLEKGVGVFLGGVEIIRLDDQHGVFRAVLAIQLVGQRQLTLQRKPRNGGGKRLTPRLLADERGVEVVAHDGGTDDRQLDIPAVFQLVHHQRDEGIRLNQAGVREGDRQREHEKKRGEPKERPNVCTHEKKPPENQTCKQGSSSMPGRKSKYSDGSSAPPCARA